MKRRGNHVNPSPRGSRDDAQTEGGGDDFRSISALPIQNLVDILSRLPFKTIFSCMCVCKKWKDLILAPEFAKLHHTRAPASLILRSHRHGRRRRPRSLCLLDLEASDICSPDAAVKLSPDFGFPTGNFEIVNTCGCLHWIVNDPSKSEFIYCLEFGRELFQPVSAPPHLGPNDKDRTGDMMLGVLGGCLYFFDYPLGDSFDIWVMKQYGVQESWTKEFILKNPSTDIIWYWDLYRPISLLSNGEILMSHKSKAMVSYNPEDRSFRFLKIYGIQNFEASPYVPSFLSPREIVKGENTGASNIHSR
ncbi:uncharacterized protein [Populus alba]|uniref:uncharacterized protein n=1 Tax=Populus alba TaxID=43335 RepID=UPI003CC79ACB